MAPWCLCYRHRASGVSPERCWSHFIFHNPLLTIKSICWCRRDGAKLGHVPFLAWLWSEKLPLLLWSNWKLKHIVTCPCLGTWIRFISSIATLAGLLINEFIALFLFKGRRNQGRRALSLVQEMVKHHSAARKDLAVSWRAWSSSEGPACGSGGRTGPSGSRALGKGDKRFGSVQTKWPLSCPMWSLTRSRDFFFFLNSLAKCNVPLARNIAFALIYIFSVCVKQHFLT